MYRTFVHERRKTLRGQGESPRGKRKRDFVPRGFGTREETYYFLKGNRRILMTLFVKPIEEHLEIFGVSNSGVWIHHGSP